MKKSLTYGFILFLFFGNGFAQSGGLQVKLPTLDGHIFQSFSNIKSSFVNTNLRSSVGVGLTSPMTVDGIMVGDNKILAFEGSLLFYSMFVEYQQRFTPWLALYVSYSISGRLGTNMSTILVDGVNTVNGGDIGWLIRIKQSRSWNISAFMNVKNLTGRFIKVNDYFDQVIAGDPYPSAVDVVPATLVSLGVSGAHSFSPTFGLQFFGEVAYGEAFDREKSNYYFSGGVVGDMNFMPKYKVPLGLGVGYVLTAAPEIIIDNRKTFSNLFTGKLAYTGSNDYELGMQLTYYNVSLRNLDENTFITKGALFLKFYF